MGTFVVPIGLLALATGIGQELQQGAPDMAGQLAGMSAIALLMLIAGVVLSITAVRMRARRRSKKEMFRLAHFAEANGLSYGPGVMNGSYLLPLSERGAVRVLDTIRTTQGRQVEFGNYEITVSSGRTNNTAFGGYVVTRAGTELPNIRLESKMVRRLAMNGAVAAEQRLSLEGDFDRYFTLTCPSGYERDALYLFTPDVMARLIDSASDFDVELVDDWVFLTSPRDIATLDPERWQAAADAMVALTAKIARWELWRDERVPHNRQNAPGAVAKGGRRLRIGFGSGAVIGVMLTAVFLSLVVLANTAR